MLLCSRDRHCLIDSIFNCVHTSRTALVLSKGRGAGGGLCPKHTHIQVLDQFQEHLSEISHFRALRITCKHGILEAVRGCVDSGYFGKFFELPATQEQFARQKGLLDNPLGPGRAVALRRGQHFGGHARPHCVVETLLHGQRG